MPHLVPVIAVVITLSTSQLTWAVPFRQSQSDFGKQPVSFAYYERKGDDGSEVNANSDYPNKAGSTLRGFQMNFSDDVAEKVRRMVEECSKKILVNEKDPTARPYLKFFEECVYRKILKIATTPHQIASREDPRYLKRALDIIDVQLGRDESSELFVTSSDEIHSMYKYIHEPDPGPPPGRVKRSPKRSPPKTHKGKTKPGDARRAGTISGKLRRSNPLSRRSKLKRPSKAPKSKKGTKKGSQRMQIRSGGEKDDEEEEEEEEDEKSEEVITATVGEKQSKKDHTRKKQTTPAPQKTRKISVLEGGKTWKTKSAEEEDGEEEETTDKKEKHVKMKKQKNRKSGQVDTWIRGTAKNLKSKTTNAGNDKPDKHAKQKKKNGKEKEEAEDDGEPEENNEAEEEEEEEEEDVEVSSTTKLTTQPTPETTTGRSTKRTTTQELRDYNDGTHDGDNREESVGGRRVYDGAQPQQETPQQEDDTRNEAISKPTWNPGTLQENQQHLQLETVDPSNAYGKEKDALHKMFEKTVQEVIKDGAPPVPRFEDETPYQTTTHQAETEQPLAVELTASAHGRAYTSIIEKLPEGAMLPPIVTTETTTQPLITPQRKLGPQVYEEDVYPQRLFKEETENCERRQYMEETKPIQQHVQLPAIDRQQHNPTFDYYGERMLWERADDKRSPLTTVLFLSRYPQTNAYGHHTKPAEFHRPPGTVMMGSTPQNVVSSGNYNQNGVVLQNTQRVVPAPGQESKQLDAFMPRTPALPPINNYPGLNRRDFPAPGPATADLLTRPTYQQETENMAMKRVSTLLLDSHTACPKSADSHVSEIQFNLKPATTGGGGQGFDGRGEVQQGYVGFGGDAYNLEEAERKCSDGGATGPTAAMSRNQPQQLSGAPKMATSITPEQPPPTVMYHGPHNPYQQPSASTGMEASAFSRTPIQQPQELLTQKASSPKLKEPPMASSTGTAVRTPTHQAQQGASQADPRPLKQPNRSQPKISKNGDMTFEFPVQGSYGNPPADVDPTGYSDGPGFVFIKAHVTAPHVDGKQLAEAAADPGPVDNGPGQQPRGLQRQFVQRDEDAFLDVGPDIVNTRRQKSDVKKK